MFGDLTLNHKITRINLKQTYLTVQQLRIETCLLLKQLMLSLFNDTIKATSCFRIYIFLHASGLTGENKFLILMYCIPEDDYHFCQKKRYDATDTVT